jgi:hypothetical protein
MAITFTSTMQGASANYMKYLWESPVKKDRYQDPILLDFALVNADASFAKLTRGSYIKITSTTYPIWYTGYVTNDPELSYLGTKGGVPAWGYKYHATSDEYILNLKPIGLLPTFMNVNMGTILKKLVSRLAPGMFDVSGIQNGPLVAQYTVDPDQTFGDVVKDFSEAASFYFYALDHKLYFAPQDAKIITLDGNNKHFTPARLDIKPASAPIINDATVLGDVEPQAYVNEYFVGTGLDAAFPLIASVFGADSSVLLDETFQGSALNGSQWNVFDLPANYLKVSNGYLNVLGGSGTGYDVSVQSVNPIPLDGRVRLTHGEWDFLSGTGIFGGLWTSSPSAGIAGCLYGIRTRIVTGRGGTGLHMEVIVNGAPDAGSVPIPIDTSKRYVIRTLAEFPQTNRFSQSYSYIDSTGTRGTYGGAGSGAVAKFDTIVTVIDPATGKTVGQFNLTTSTTLSSSASYAIYVPAASIDMHATVTGITVSVPLNASLETTTQPDFSNLSFEDWNDPNTPTGWNQGTQSVFKETTFVGTGVASMKMQADGTGVSYVAQGANATIQASVGYNVSVRVQKTAPTTVGSLDIALTGTGVTTSTFTIPVSSMDTSYATFSGRLTPVDGIGVTTVPSDLALVVRFHGATPNVGAVYVDSIVITTDWQTQILGPNEIDASDGYAPIATITGGNIGSDTKSTLTGSAQYNPGQYQLVFFKDSVTRSSNIPPENLIMRLSYRSAGPAIGRSVNRSGILAESQKWLDDGVRSIVKKDLTPRPRNSSECEMAAAAIVAENSFVHYEGRYTQFSQYFTEEPISGSILKFTNLTNMAPVTAEEVNEVTTTIESEKPSEIFSHAIAFGKVDHLRRLLTSFDEPKGAYQRGQTSTVKAVDYKSIGVNFSDDVVKPSLVGWDDTNLYMDAGQALTGQAFEVRYTDDGWGAEDGKNLVTRTTNRTFAVPRNLRGRVFFIRQAKTTNLITYSEDLSQGIYTGASAALSTKQNPDGDLSTIGTVVLGSGSSLNVSGGSGTCFSFSINGPSGKRMSATFGGTTVNFVCTGFWQRVTVTGSGSTGSVTAIDACTVDLTRFSIESGPTVETAYVKTNGTAYGPPSRYSAAVHVSFPVPAVSASDITNLVVRPTY